MKRGFTVVEVLITLIVIAILLGLGSVGLRATLANGRDSERKADVETIARMLEQRYDNGNDDFVLDPAGFFYPNARKVVMKGTYPGNMEFKYGVGYPKGEFTPATHPDKDAFFEALNINKAAATAPGGWVLSLVCYPASCSPAEDQAQLVAAFTSSGTIQDRYVYEPVDANGNICNAPDFNYDVCTSFNLYWVSETDTATYKSIPGLKVVRSKHQ